MKTIEEITDELIDVLKQGPNYQAYYKQQELVKNCPDVLEKINEIRSLNIQLQSIQNEEQAYDELERLENRYDELSQDKRVYDFIEAENRFIKVYQDMYRKIMEQIQFI